jgi:hypothetical protein
MKKSVSTSFSKIIINDRFLINSLLFIFMCIIFYLTINNVSSIKMIKESFGVQSQNYDYNYRDPRVLSIEAFTNPTNTEKKDDKKEEKKELVRDSNGIPTVEFPFKNLFDQNGNKLNIILLAAPFRGPDHDAIYQELKNQTPKLHFMGISSYCEFPGHLSNPFDSRYHEQQKHVYETMVTSWLNCFRNPAKYINPNFNLPILDLSESDLRDANANKPDTSIKKEYDFIYICLNDNDKCTPGWQSYNRNWELAKKCLDIMCGKYKLKGAIIGRENCEFSNLCSGIVKVHPFLAYHEFQKELQKAKFLFVPNVADASPRVITESMCYDLRLLVNYNILGGWKYVTPESGELFNDIGDFEHSLNKLLQNMDKYQPRKHFTDNYGKEKSGKELANFIKKHYGSVVVPSADKIEYTTITI